MSYNFDHDVDIDSIDIDINIDIDDKVARKLNVSRKAMATTKKDKPKAKKAPIDPHPDFTLKKSQMLEALEKSLGVVTTAAQKAGISRRQHYNWLKSDPAYCEAVAEINNISLDLAESKLFTAVNNGELSAIIFFLKCKGKKRGYIERPADEPQPQDNNKPEIYMRPARLAESDED